MPQLADGPTTASVLARSNICGAQRCSPAQAYAPE
jgi:hypothetical protein